MAAEFWGLTEHPVSPVECLSPSRGDVIADYPIPSLRTSVSAGGWVRDTHERTQSYRKIPVLDAPDQRRMLERDQLCFWRPLHSPTS